MQVLLYARPVAMWTCRGSAPKFFNPPNFVMPRKVCFKHIPPWKQKFCPLNSLFCPQNLATGLLYASLDLQTSGILTVLTSRSANVSDFSQHIIFAVSWHRICDLTVAMIKKTLIAFITCVVIRSLCLLW